MQLRDYMFKIINRRCFFHMVSIQSMCLPAPGSGNTEWTWQISGRNINQQLLWTNIPHLTQKPLTYRSLEPGSVGWHFFDSYTSRYYWPLSGMGQVDFQSILMNCPAKPYVSQKDDDLDQEAKPLNFRTGDANLHTNSCS